MNDAHVHVAPDGLVRFSAFEGTDPTDWNGDEARMAAKALRSCAAKASDGPSRPMNRDEKGVFSLGTDGPHAFDIGGAIGVRAGSQEGGPCVLTASEALSVAAALETLADEYDGE